VTRTRRTHAQRSLTSWQTASPYLETAWARRSPRRLARGYSREDAGLAERIAQWLAECEALEQSDFQGRRRGGAHALFATGACSWAHIVWSPLGHGGMGSVWLAERPTDASRGARRRQAAERGPCRSHGRGAFRARRSHPEQARASADRTFGMRVSRQSVSRIWCWSTWRAKRSTSIATASA
jgi:hypothetical protein